MQDVPYTNQLIHESSPYLVSHAHQPVCWLPWGDKAFQKAYKEDKPIFLSIGYSTCHWCHVMAHESFEDAQVAQLLNEGFVPVKVDKEQRPDIDSVYMDVCLALIGSGGWPMTIVMDEQGRPFFAGTYLPKHSRYGMMGLTELLGKISRLWNTDRQALIKDASAITAHVSAKKRQSANAAPNADRLAQRALKGYKAAFDKQYGGFGRAPKFPMGHTLMFLMQHGDMDMAEKTFINLAKGGIFDQIGYGFSRYATDEKWLVPHFEKMLYDNALLLSAYAMAYQKTQKPFYQVMCAKLVHYLKRDLLSAEGGFYSAQDADSENEEGKFYVFKPEEIIRLIGKEQGAKFNMLYDITLNGNFEGKSIPNQMALAESDDSMTAFLDVIYDYRKTRMTLKRDEKILTAWNGLTIAALCDAYQAIGDRAYLNLAKDATAFVQSKLQKDDRLFVSYLDGKQSGLGYLDDYAFMVHGLISLYRVTVDKAILCQAVLLMKRALMDFFDQDEGGFFLYGTEHEELISRPKPTHDGAMPSGNSVMLLNLVYLSWLTSGEGFEAALDKQESFMLSQTMQDPMGHAFCLMAFKIKAMPPKKIVAVLDAFSKHDDIAALLPKDALCLIMDHPGDAYPLKDGKTTYYVCRGHACEQPTNVLNQ